MVKCEECGKEVVSFYEMDGHKLCLSCYDYLRDSGKKVGERKKEMELEKAQIMGNNEPIAYKIVTEKQEIEESEKRQVRCPNCNHYVPGDSNVCSYCGKAIFRQEKMAGGQYLVAKGLSLLGVFLILIGIVATIFLEDNTTCFIIGFIGVLLILIGGFYSRSTHQQVPQKMHTTSDKKAYRNCPHCGRAITFEVNVCPYCEKQVYK